MNHSILSNQINPYVRFAGLREQSVNDYDTFVYAKDCRMFYFTDGFCTLYAGDEVFDIKKNDLVIVPALIPYFADYSKKDSHTSLYNINFDYLSCDCTIDRAISVSTKKITKTHQKVHITDFPFLDLPFKTNIEGLLPYFEKMAELYSKKSFYFKSEMNSYFSLVLSQVFKHILNEKSQNNISKVLDFIHLNYNQPLTNEEIGKKFGYHPNYLNKMFVTYTGSSLHKYLINYRIEKAQLFLGTKNLSVTEVAEKTGWRNLAQFSKAFKNITGTSPKNFKII